MCTEAGRMGAGEEDGGGGEQRLDACSTPAVF
jgi:hypothetical protein